MTIQNSQTNNYLTVLSGDEGTLYYTTLQEKDEQKWRLVSEENGTYFIESKTKQFLSLSETNNLLVDSNDSKQRESIELPAEETLPDISSSSENSTESTNQTTDEVEVKEKQSRALQSNIVKTASINRTMKLIISNPNGGNVTEYNFRHGALRMVKMIPGG